MKQIKEIWYIALATGSTNIDAEFNVRSLEELTSLVYEKITKIPGIIDADTSLIMKFVKRDYDWGTAMD